MTGLDTPRTNPPLSYILPPIALLLLALLSFFLFTKIDPVASEPALEFETRANATPEVAGEVSTIMVEVSGAVGRPAVYELPAGSRVIAFLEAAGGISNLADKGWVERNVNLAAPVTDGSKIYIPRVGEESSKTESVAVGNSSVGSTAKININTASLSELDTLWGIGTVRAQAIIDNRPYQGVEELLEKKVVPTNVYAEIKDLVAIN